MNREHVADNARRLLKDAEILIAADRNESATALAVLAIEEVGKIIADIVDGRQERMPPNWHKRKGQYVSLLLTAQICSLEVGKEVLLPGTADKEDIQVDDELADLLFAQTIDAERGKKLGQYLFFKSGGRVDAEQIRKSAEADDWLRSGFLHDLKTRAMYRDFGKPALLIDGNVAGEIVMLARKVVRMCRKIGAA